MFNIDRINITDTFRSGYVAIVGEPNVGKSTLLNSLVGQKIAAVTNKPQTTRHKILGILSTESYQIIFLDTPGLLKPRYLLHEVMMKAAVSAIEDADLILFMIDAMDPKIKDYRDDNIAFTTIKKSEIRAFLLINKIDLVDKQDILPIIAFYSDKYPFQEIFPVSALKNIGIEELTETIVGCLSEHPPYYPLDVVSEYNERYFVGEIIREKIFEKYKEEIPYSTTVDVIDFKEQKDRKDLIRADIYVERESQKGILIGKQGKALKDIGELSRKEIEKFLDRPVYLELHVKVREKWKEDAAWLKRFGYSL
ncbi:MAG: GTPase Era [Ignavibacteriales bacterium]|nr:GTPase Era [Ignavibacteriales bacterium]